jgi:membrane protease YdiL (CAAX protease family)
LRYLNFMLFVVALTVSVALLEGFYWITSSGISVLDGKGVGPVPMYLLALAMVFLFSKFIARDSPFWLTAWYFIHWRRMITGYLAMFFISIAAVVVGYSILGALGKITITERGFSGIPFSAYLSLVPIFFSVLALTSAEEVIFRSFIMRYLRWNTTLSVTVGAMVFSSLVFAFVHNLSDPMAWLTYRGMLLFIGLFILGLVLCLTYVLTRSLMCAAGVHAGLVYTQFFRYRTRSFDLEPDVWWMGVSQDIRMAPFAWVILIFIAVLVILLRHRFKVWFEIENDVVGRGTLPQ